MSIAILFVIVAAGFLSTVAGAVAPQLKIECPSGCSRFDFDFRDTYTFWVNQNDNQNTITLRMIDLTAGSGQYTWLNNGATVHTGAEYSFSVKGDISFVANVTSSGGSDQKNVNVILVIPIQDRTLPQWSESLPFSWDEDLHRTYFAQGDSFKAKANLNKACNKPCMIVWKAFVNDIEVKGFIFSNVNNPSTDITVGSDVAPGDYDIKATLYLLDDPNKQTSEKKFRITVVKKPNAPEIEIEPDPVIKSYTQFRATVRKKVNDNSINNIKSCTVDLRNESIVNEQGIIIAPGTIVYSTPVSTTYGQALLPVPLYPEDPGAYTIEANCMDFFGNSVKANTTIPVGFGRTRREKPYMIVNKTIYCLDYKNCSINYTKTNDYSEDNISIGAEYFIMTGVAPQYIDDVPMHKCLGYKSCPLNLTAAENQTIRLESYYQWRDSYNKFVYSARSIVTITVIVGQSQPPVAASSETQASQPITATSTETAPSVQAPQTSQVAVTPEYPESRYKRTPGTGTFEIASIFVILVLIRKLQK